MNDVDDGSSTSLGDADAINDAVANSAEVFEAALPLLTTMQAMQVASDTTAISPRDNRPLPAVLMNDETKSLKDIGPPADDDRQPFD